MSGNDADTERSTRSPEPESRVERAPQLGAAAQLRLGAALARYSDSLLCEPMPDVFLALLAKLEAKEPEE
jgi:Anti-sigma factor NepR